VLRTFLAAKIEPTPGLRRLHARLGDLGDRFRPVALDNLHVTLKFLGDTRKPHIADICAAAAPIVERQAAILVRLSGIGAFPNVRRPSVVWLGLGDATTLSEIAGELDRAMTALGFAAEARPFQPHLTLLRIKSRPPEELFSLLAEESAAEYGIVPVDAIELFQSELTPRGSQYTRLAKFALSPPKVEEVENSSASKRS